MIDWDLTARVWLVGALIVGVFVGAIMDDEETDKAFPPSYALIVLWPLSIAVMFGGALRGALFAVAWIVTWPARKVIAIRRRSA